MAVRELKRPAGVGGRGSKYHFSRDEVETAVGLVKKGKTPGVGPYEDLREARSAAQALVRAVYDAMGDEAPTLGTSGWVNPDDGKAYCQVVVKG